MRSSFAETLVMPQRLLIRKIRSWLWSD